MKKDFQILLILAALFCCGQVWSTTTYYYSALKAQVSSTSSGQGMVYAGTSTTAGTYDASSSTSSSQRSSTQNTEMTFYAFAQANDGYVFTGWSNSENGTVVSTNNPYSVNVKCSSTSSSPTPTTVYANFKQAENITISLQTNAQCTTLSATYGSSNLSAGGTSTAVPSSTPFALTCAPASGYKVYRWWYEVSGVKTYFGFAQSTVSSYLFPTTCIVGVELVDINTPIFQIKGKVQVYTNLTDANNAASSGDVIALVSDGILTSGTYTIKSGVTLFIPPYNYKGNVPTTQPDAWCKHSDRNGTYNKNLSTDNSKDMSELDRHLTLDKDVTLTINGILATGGARWLTVGNTGQTTTAGDFRMDTKYGLISLNSGSSIILNNGSKLYCWGRIRGEGTITAKSGSQVYESFVYMDHRELEAFGEIAKGNKVFIMNQYYVQDIQAPITFESGSQETLATAFFHYSTSSPATGSFGFVGTSSSNSLFELPSGATLTKRYNVDKDRLEFDLNNGVNINQIKISISSVGTYSTSSNILTITHNWSLNVKSGTTNIQQSLHFAPGAELNLAKGATVNVASGKTLSIYDKNDWGLFACNNTIIPLYLPSYELNVLKYYDNTTPQISHPKTKVEAGNGTAYDAIRTKGNLTHATILVNGTLNMNGGLYTTFSGTANDGRGANICSDGGGIITFKSAQGATTTITELFGCARNTDVPQTTSVNVQPALLHNVNNNDPANTNGTYTSTAGAAANTTYKYVASISQWGKVSTVTFKNGDATIKSEKLAEGETINAPANPTKTGYTFNGWNNNYTGTMPESDVTYSAQWTANNYTLTFDANGGSDVAPITQGYETAITAPANPTRVGYTFAGWNPTLPDKMPLDGGSYTAQWTINQYTISFNANGGSSVDAITQDYLSDVTAPAAPTREGHTFAGWQPAVPTTMPLNGETCVAQWTVNQYTISFNVNGGLEDIASKTQDYGTAIEAPANPTFEGYVFAGWDPALPATMPAENITCVAQWELKIVNIEVKSEETEITKSDGSKEIVTETTYTLGNGETTVQAQSDTVVIEANATLVVKNKVNLDVATAITVGEDATIEVAAEATVKAEALVLNASPSVIDIENDKAGASSQVICDNESALAAIENVYIDVKMDASGNLDGSKYYAFAVPFKVNVADGVQKIDNKGEVTAAINNTHYRAYTYNGKNRADKGKGSNWDQVTSGTFNPGVFYLVEFADGKYNTFRFQAADKDINNEGKIALTGYGDGDANNPNNGWNGIANNALHSAKISVAGGQAVQVFDPIAKAFIPAELGTTNFSIGTPMMVQVLANDTAINSPVAAPARMLAAQEDNTFGNYTIRIKAEGAAKMADQLFISASENAASEYVIGKDIVKMFMGNATVAQLWVNDYDKKLAMNQAVLTNDMATASLTLYAPKAGSYSVYLKNIPEDATIYLMQNGQSAACLNDGACTVELTKGENTSYSIRIHTHKSPQVTTSMDEIVNSEEVQKVLLDGVVYIVRDGKMYNTLGIER